MPRGRVTNPIECPQCHLKRAKEGLCQICRMHNSPSYRQKAFWTPEQIAMLKRMYQEAKSKPELSKAITDLARRTGFRRNLILHKALRLGLRIYARNAAWTDAERQALQNHAGEMALTAIAQKLGRTYYATKVKAFELGILTRVIAGYSQRELSDILGVTQWLVAKWVERKWLTVGDSGRISERSVSTFLRKHPEQYRLNRVDEAWFKGMIFPAMGINRGRREEEAIA